ncbi:MAG: cyclic nucleotide-binding domain-containing protein, partial [Cyanobacteria bacterium P01_H01_bin.119]
RRTAGFHLPIVLALELLLIHQSLPSQAEIDGWLVCDRQELQMLGAIAQKIANPDAKPAWPQTLEPGPAKILTRVVTYGETPHLKPLIAEVLLSQTRPEVICAGLEALLTLTQRGDETAAGIAQNQLNHRDPLVRMVAFDLLRVARCPEQLAAIGEGLKDSDPRVRQRAARALAAQGRAGLKLAKASLDDSRIEVVNSAITAIGLVRTKYASNLLYDYLAPSYKQLVQTRRWQQQIPNQDPRWHPLKAAIEDYHDRLVQKVLYVLSALGHGRTVNEINRLLAARDRNELANAVEVLASLNHRRFVMPLMPLFESSGSASMETAPPEPPLTQPTTERDNPTPQWLRTRGYRVLLEALESKDRWIRIGALIALSSVPSALVHDSDSIVKQVAKEIFGPVDASTLPTNTTMNRLLLLKNVALFRNLSLDELLLIDKSLESAQVLANETIFDEGDWGSHLYIIADGTVQLTKAIDGNPRLLNQLGRGQYFGEVALFDDAPRWDGAIAQSDCTLLKLEKNRFLSLVTQRPHIILEMCRFLSQRLRETDKHRSEASPEQAQADSAQSPRSQDQGVLSA